MQFWNREAETMSRDQLADVQLKGLQKSLRRVWSNEWSRRLLLSRGFGNPEDVKSLDDLKRIPFLTKDDFRDAYPLQMCTVPRQELLEFHMSSGSTGTPVVMAYTKNDLNQWADCMARCYTMAGLEAGDAFQIMPTFGLFNGGFGCYHGARKAQKLRKGDGGIGVGKGGLVRQALRSRLQVIANQVFHGALPLKRMGHG